MPELDPLKDEVLAELDRLLAWPEMARSSQLARFLHYIVSRTLAGDQNAIKAYAIAVDVLGRPSDFDPQADPIVRVQARRLRAMLDQYYAGPGTSNPLQIRLPVGRYVPEFRPAAARVEVAAPQPMSEETRPEPRGRVTLSWFALLVILAGIGLAVYAVSTWDVRQQNIAANAGSVQRPSIAIVEFQNLAGQGEGAPQSSGLAIELVTDLEQFEDIDVRYAGTGDIATVAGEGPGTDFMLSGIVRPDGLAVQYSAILTDSRTGNVVWNRTVPVTAAQAQRPEVLDGVSRAFSLVLGSTRGPLHGAGRSFMASDAPLEGQVNLYLCRVAFDLYRDSGTSADANRANACLDALPERERSGPFALAMAASLIADYASPDITPVASPADRYRIAETNLERAIVAEPISGFIWEQRARLHQARGDFAKAASDYGSSIQLNPASADALAAYARLLAFSGRLDEAEALSRDATEWAPDPPAWYHVVPALMALRAEDYAEALECSELYAQADKEIGPVLAILAAQGTGDSALVNRYLAQVLDTQAFRANGVLTRLSERISDRALLDTIRTGLIDAGVPQKSLVASF